MCTECHFLFSFPSKLSRDLTREGAKVQREFHILTPMCANSPTRSKRLHGVAQQSEPIFQRSTGELVQSRVSASSFLKRKYWRDETFFHGHVIFAKFGPQTETVPFRVKFYLESVKRILHNSIFYVKDAQTFYVSFTFLITGFHETQLSLTQGHLNRVSRQYLNANSCLCDQTENRSPFLRRSRNCRLTSL